MADFLMPALGADMETGTVVQWLVEPGARVRSGDVVAVVETHKGAIDVECFLDGVIDAMVPVGRTLPVGAVLARVEPVGREAVVVPEGAAVATMAGPAQRATPQAVAAATVPSRSPDQAPSPPARGRISPAARRRAVELGVDPSAWPGSGADGAVIVADVEAAAAATAAGQGQGAARAAGTAEVSAGGTGPAPEVHRGFDPAAMRQAIAAAMARSKREIPHYYLGSTLDFGAAQAWLEAFNATRDPAERLLPAALLAKATAIALRAVPELNGFVEDGAFRPSSRVHLGWAIALRGGGLVAPAIHDADTLSLPALMQSLRDLVQRARTGRLRGSELSDPTVTATSLGERGAESVLGVIHPPQVAIVGFGRIVVRPWVVDGAVVPRPVLSLSLAADHRVSDGHRGGQLLAAIDAALQHPEQL